MSKSRKFNKCSSSLSNCNLFANQNLILLTIISAIIGEEIDDNEELSLLGSFFVVLGEQLLLISESRTLCENTLDENNLSETKLEKININETLSRSNKHVKKIHRKTNKNKRL